ncbi:helix-turn-helix domain-containing protein [Runella slithyformis]|uniref:Helix-turn-helix, AraC domain protein n=1 Tax=Runella slithyformis (strain ATCC 29530 / DSM 19594 / LMG 11500 / NCIMB 11436 / LSU 4) TaxID=761193 RepID=A0A7U3ZQS2_RUNSL|nr:helix-turn-helix domain-containing protein [Runella slithyformis]AEI51631.1 Helix-turn-helix, AraC domain protein [Runella slithyformis DSM 19594]
MVYHFFRDQLGADLSLHIDNKDFDRQFFGKNRPEKYLTIAYNCGEAQKVTVDEVTYAFPANSILPLVVNQSFHFEKPEHIVAWQFNREFYCIIDHDQEVSCVGFLFYGWNRTLFLPLDAAHRRKIDLLIQIFIDEFETVDTIQSEMLLMLLKRLIIIITRLAKQQQFSETELPDARFDIIREYNILVEHHYKKQHQVAFYAEKLNRSPKTLSNYFAIYGTKTPQQLIHERIMLEAKRLFYYTDKSAKEVAYELGFEDAAYFSHFLKKQTGISTTDFKNKRPKALEGK